MFEGHDQAIYDLLAGHRLVEPALLHAAWREHRATHRPLAALLSERSLVTKPALLQAVADHLACDCTVELPAALPPALLALVDGRLACARAIAPLAVNGAELTVVAVDPFSATLADDLAFVLGREVRLSVADPEGVRRLIRQHYGEPQSPPGTATAGVPAPVAADDEPVLSVTDMEQMAGQAPIIQLVNGILSQAIMDEASDIHFEPFEQDFRVRCRIDGHLHEMPPPPRDHALPVISRLKVLAGLNIAERRRPQDGRIKLSLRGRPVDLRVSTLPTQFGESVVLRVLDPSAVRLEFAHLGLPVAIQAGVEEVIRRPSGIFIVTGPTGSGKTTTLYSCLRALNSTGAKLLTVEDPVEYEIDGVMQVPVNPGAGLTFARALRSFLRQDPDIVMVGEIRDVETAQIAIQAALTGHLVLTTLHTNDAASAVTRLADMGIEPFLIASTLEAVLAQRLVRRLCPMCRRLLDPGEIILRHTEGDYAALRGRPIHAAAGCPACHQTGYKGRLGLFEFLPMTDALRERVTQGASLAQLRQVAVARGMTPLRASGLQAVLTGGTSVEEVDKCT